MFVEMQMRDTSFGDIFAEIAKMMTKARDDQTQNLPQRSNACNKLQRSEILIAFGVSPRIRVQRTSLFGDIFGETAKMMTKAL